MGWYDANPVNLNPLTPSDSARKYVEYMGDPEEILKKAREDFEKGEYQWVAEITNVLVYADPANEQARYLCADALEQLAYQAESGTWRNAYLSGALELRNGTTDDQSKRAKSSADLQKTMTPEMMFDQMGILLDANAAQDLNLKINFNITDAGTYLVTIDSGVLLYQEGVKDEKADATLTLPRTAMFSILTRNEEQQRQGIKIEGDQEILKKLNEHMVAYEFFFNIVEP